MQTRSNNNGLSLILMTGYCGAFRFRVWWSGEWVEVVNFLFYFISFFVFF